MSRISTRAMFTYSRFEIPLFAVVLCCSTNILLFSLSATTGLILFYDQASLTYYCSRNKVTFWPKGTQPYCPLNTAYVSYNNRIRVFFTYVESCCRHPATSEGPKYNDKDRLWKITRDKVSTAVQSKFGTVRSFTAYFMSVYLTSEDADRIINMAYYGMARNSEPISMTFR